MLSTIDQIDRTRPRLWSSALSCMMVWLVELNRIRPPPSRAQQSKAGVRLPAAANPSRPAAVRTTPAARNRRRMAGESQEAASSVEGRAPTPNAQSSIP